MKKLIFLTIFVNFCLGSFGQQSLTFEKVITTDSVGKNAIYVAINDWFATTFNSANDVLQMADKEAGMFVGNGSMDYSHRGITYTAYTGYVRYTIKVVVKDNRYKVTVTNFIHENMPNYAQSCRLGLITNNELYAEKGANKKFHNEVWTDIKGIAEQLSNDFFLSMEQRTKSLTNTNSNDNW